jgi:hypothetical protein
MEVEELSGTELPNTQLQTVKLYTRQRGVDINPTNASDMTVN